MDRRGLLYLISAALVFSVMSVLVKTAGHSMPAPMMVLARAVVTFVLSFFWLRNSGVNPWGNNHKGLLLRAAFGFGGLFTYYTAVTKLPLADVTVIHYLNPITTALLAALVLGEALGARLIVALFVAISGVVLVARPTFLVGDVASLDPMGLAYAIASALFASAAYVMVRKLRATEAPLVIVFWFAMIAVPASLPFVIPVWVWPSPVEWLLLLGIGVVTQIAQVLLTHGLVLVPAGPAMTVGYLQILFATLWGYALFDEKLSGLTLAGALLVFVGAAVVALGKARPASSP